MAKIWSIESVAGIVNSVEWMRYENWFASHAGDWRGVEAGAVPRPRDWICALWTVAGEWFIFRVQKRIHWVCSGGYARGAGAKRGPSRKNAVAAAIGKRKLQGKRERKESAPYVKRERGKRRIQRKRERRGMIERLATADRSNLESVALGNLFANDSKYIRENWEWTKHFSSSPDNYYLAILFSAIARAVGKAVAGEDSLEAVNGKRGKWGAKRELRTVQLPDTDVTLKARDKRGERIPLWQHVPAPALCQAVLRHVQVEAGDDSLPLPDVKRLNEVGDIVATLTSGERLRDAIRSRLRKRLHKLGKFIRNHLFADIVEYIPLPPATDDCDRFPLPVVPLESRPASPLPLNKRGVCGEVVDTCDCIGAEHIRRPAIFAKSGNEPLWLTLRTKRVEFANYRPTKVSERERDGGYESPLTACSPSVPPQPLPVNSGPTSPLPPRPSIGQSFTRPQFAIVDGRLTVVSE